MQIFMERQQTELKHKIQNWVQVVSPHKRRWVTFGISLRHTQGVSLVCKTERVDSSSNLYGKHCCRPVTGFLWMGEKGVGYDPATMFIQENYSAIMYFLRFYSILRFRFYFILRLLSKRRLDLFEVSLYMFNIDISILYLTLFTHL